MALAFVGAKCKIPTYEKYGPYKVSLLCKVKLSHPQIFKAFSFFSYTNQIISITGHQAL